MNVASVKKAEHKSKLYLCAFFYFFLGLQEEEMRTPLIAANSISKPSIRKHSCFEKLFMDHRRHQHQQQQEKQSALAFAFSSSPSPSPSRKAHRRIYTCICFFFFFFITVAAFLHCSNLDAPPIVEERTVSEDPNSCCTSKAPDLSAEMVKMKPMPALRGLGTVFRRGTKAVNELVVAHVAENTALQDFRLFLRTLHRSGVTARADIVFLFAWNALPSAMVDAIHEENHHFHKLLLLLSKNNVGDAAEVSNSSSSLSLFSASSSSLFPLSIPSPRTSYVFSNATISPFNIHAFRKAGSESEPSAQPLWGVRIANLSQTNRTDDALALGWGSMVGFDVTELNPDDTLQGFIDHPPLTLRRWACYQMLLGMVRHKFKHILLTSVGGVAVLGDPLVMARRKVGLYLSLEDRAWGASIEDELGLKWGSLDAELNSDFEHLATSVVLQSNSDIADNRRQLNAYRKGSWSGASGRDDVGAKSGAPDAGKKGDFHKAGFSRDQISMQLSKAGMRRQSSAQLEMHRRSGGGRRRRGRKAAAAGGLYERVYGRRMWSSLEDVEKRMKLVNSGAIVGGIQQIRGLANTMVTEIVKVALERKNREAFPDSVLLSYLLHKSSSVLGKRVLEHLHLMDNSESFVHSLIGSQQPSFFLKRTRAAYPMIHGSSKSKRWGAATRAIHSDICSSPADAMVYSDCSQPF